MDCTLLDALNFIVDAKKWKRNNKIYQNKLKKYEYYFFQVQEIKKFISLHPIIEHIALTQMQGYDSHIIYVTQCNK